MKIFFYCPDRHILFEGPTPDRAGVGGGITARLRIATALASAGHDVTVFGNIGAPALYRKVQYRPADESLAAGARDLVADVLVVHSSGGALDVGEVGNLQVKSRVRVLLVSGVDCPKNAEYHHFDAIYAPSNFIAGIVRTQWPLSKIPVFVADYGVAPLKWFHGLLPIKRREKRMIYTSHPSKGLDAAIRLLRLLRRMDSSGASPGYELHVFGGNALWGMAEAPPNPEPGLVYHDMIGQERLATEYRRSGIAIHLQNREEPFGISLVESLAGGCVVVASPTGAFPELVAHGRSGYLIPGDPAQEQTLQLAADAIHGNPKQHESMRRAGKEVPFSWKTLAKVWGQHLGLLLGNASPVGALGKCGECGGHFFQYPDGSHCSVCGSYRRGKGGF